MLCVRKAGEPFWSFYINKASDDLQKATHKKWLFVLSSVLIIPKIWTVFVLILKYETITRLFGNLTFGNVVILTLIIFVVAFLLSTIIESFCINWYVGLFFTLLNLISFVFVFVGVVRFECIVKYFFHYIILFSSIFFISYIANFLFKNKTYKLFFVFWSLITALFLSVLVCLLGCVFKKPKAINLELSSLSSS